MEISKQAFLHIWEYLGFHTLPLALNILPAGISDTEISSVRAAVQDEVRKFNLGDRDSDDALRGLFSPLHRFELCYDAVYRFGPDVEQRHTAMAAATRGAATLAIQTEDKIRMRTARADSLHREIMHVLPEVKAGTGKSVSLRSEQLDRAGAQAGESNQAMIDALSRGGLRRGDARALVEMSSGERVGYAQFGASRMNELGKRHRMAVTTFFGTTRGWYLLEETRRGGDAWTTIAPIDRSGMVGRVSTLARR